MPAPIFKNDGDSKARVCWPVMRALESRQLREVGWARSPYPGRRIPHGILPGVEAVGFWDAAMDQDWGLGWHRNEGIEIMFQESGGVGFTVNDQHFQLKPGDITFTRPWQEHMIGDPNVRAGRIYLLLLDVGVSRPHHMWRWPPWIVLTSKDMKELTDILRHNEQPVWRATADTCRRFEQIGETIATDCDGNNFSLLTMHLNYLILSVLEMFRKQSLVLDESLSSAHRTVQQFWDELCNNEEYLTKEWTVASMAKRCGMGVTSFIQHSRQLTNRTPGQYLNHCRLRLAAQLLRSQPKQSITQVAMDCGFASSQYFATAFLHHFGKPPREFRRQCDGCQSQNDGQPRVGVQGGDTITNY